MDIDQLRAFCQLAQVGNYRLASEQLYISQSTLTKKIQRLESDISTVLFRRGRSGAQLTQAGKTLLPEARRIVASFDAFQALTSAVAKGTQGHLNIGFGISTYRQAPLHISHFKHHYPRVHISLNDIPSQRQTALLLTGELQLSFNRLPVSSPLKGIRLFSDQLVVAVHDSVSIDNDDLWLSLMPLDYLRLTPSRGRGLSQQIDAFLQQENRPLQAQQDTDDISTLLSLVSARLGYTIIPASAKAIGQPQIRYIPLTGAHACWDVGLIWNECEIDPLRDIFVQNVQSNVDLV
jgi:DNA-binding transcriptional LysR family regulator